MLNTRTILSLALMGLVLFAAFMGEHVRGEEDKPRPPLLLWRTVGLSIDVDTEEITPARQVIACAVLEPKIDNLTLIPLFVIKGVLRIGASSNNITEGRGVLVMQRRAVALFCNGTTLDGEGFTYRLLGRFARTPRGLRLIMLVGTFKIEERLQYVLLFFGRPDLFLPKNAQTGLQTRQGR